MDVGVDRDRGDAVAEDEDAVRGLRTDAGKRDELIEVLRNYAAEPVQDLARHDAEDPRLHSVETGHADQRFDLGPARLRERTSVGESGEETGARGVGVRIPRPLR